MAAPRSNRTRVCYKQSNPNKLTSTYNQCHLDNLKNGETSDSYLFL